MDSMDRDRAQCTPSVPAAAATPPAQGLSGPASRIGIEAVLGAAVMALLVLLTLVNVIVRYFSDQSFAWTEEISVFLLIVLTLLGTAWAIAQDSHIRIDFFYVRGSSARKRLLGLLFASLTLALFGLLAVLMARAGWSEYEFGETTMGTGAARWWYTACQVPIAVWVVLRAAQHWWQCLRGHAAATEGGAR